MALVMISIDRSKLPPHTQDEFEEWVKYNVGDTPHINDTNPLSDIDMEAKVREVGTL